MKTILSKENVVKVRLSEIKRSGLTPVEYQRKLESKGLKIHIILPRSRKVKKND